MADDSLSLLFRLKADNAQAKAVIADTRASVAQLRQSFGPQLSQTVTVTNKAFSDLGNNLSNFVAQRVPLVGGAIVRVTEGLRGFSSESGKTDKAIASVARSIESIATQSGKSVPVITNFLTKFVQLEGQATRDKAAVDFFGASLATKLVPELEKTGTALASVAGQSAATGTSIAAMAGPVGIVVLALAALSAGAVIAAREIFQLTKFAADFQGRMVDLAQQTGVEVETLSALEVVARRTGGSIDNLTQALVGFQRNLDEAQDPLSQTAERFRKLGIDTANTETALRQTFVALAAMPVGFAQTNAAAELFGARGGKQVLAILKETNGDLDQTIKKFRELGILITDDAARAADKFNDDLELLNFQIRSLAAVAAEDLIPVVADVIRTFTELVRVSRPLISAFGSLTATALRPAADGLKGLSLIVQALTRDYDGLARSIKEAGDASTIAPIAVPSLGPVPLPRTSSERQAATEAANQADAVVAAVKRSVAASSQALDELFQKGRRDTLQQAEETIATNKRLVAAEQQRIDAQLTLREQEIKALDEAQRNRGEIVRRDTEDYRAITKEIGKLQQERLNNEAEFVTSSRALRAAAAKARADADRQEVQNNTNLVVAEIDNQIRIIEEGSRRRALIEPITFLDLSERIKEERKDLAVVQLLEQAKVDARRESLEQQRQIGTLTVEEQRKINAQINQLNQEADLLAQEHADERIQIALDEVRRFGEVAQLLIDAQLAQANASIRVGEIGDRARIASIQALADLRVKTEEQASREILAIRLEAIEREKALADIELEAVNARNETELEAIRTRRRAIETELKNVGTIEDPATRQRKRNDLIKEQLALVNVEIEAVKRANAEKEKAEADHNNKTRVLNAERTATQSQGNRDIDEGRQKDIENARRYAEQLRDLEERTRRVQRDAAEEAIRLMIATFARRRDIIRARRDLELKEEDDRHRLETESLRQQTQEVDEQIKVLETYLTAFKATTAEEIKEREKIIDSLEKLRLKRLELQSQQDAEDGRNTTRKRTITAESDKDEQEASPLGRLGFDVEGVEEFASLIADAFTSPIEALRDAFRELQDAAREFVVETEDSIVPLGEILRGTFSQVADAIGQTVANWVLLGETGPAVMRKILAQALASLAAEAAVNAIKELALGFATLFFNPAESAAHFTAAGLWASIGVGSALAGRGVAGDLFKSKSAGAGGGSGASGELNPLNLQRNAGPLAPGQQAPIIHPIVTVNIVPDGTKFGNAVTAHVVEDFNNTGAIRQVISGDGNLNRG